jgi:hypothetical protein
MPMEKTILDKFVQGGFMGKRAIGRPVKYNVRNRGMQGWIELCFSPRTKVEEYVAGAMKFVHPYLFFITYRFHVEKAREGGKSHKNRVKSAEAALDNLFQPLRTLGQCHESLSSIGSFVVSLSLHKTFCF